MRAALTFTTHTMAFHFETFCVEYYEYLIMTTPSTLKSLPRDKRVDGVIECKQNSSC
eukprot:m.146799 g.146799  ORF g.146799 m.146799 type:complete len:57 (+) comp30499_c3_seq1:744-914(+)